MYKTEAEITLKEKEFFIKRLFIFTKEHVSNKKILRGSLKNNG
jgi:hypothetical protein